MPFNRIFDAFPSLEQIQAIEGAFIVDESPSGGVVGARVGKVAIVGETLKGTPGVAYEIASPSDFRALVGGWNKYVGDGATYGYDGSVATALSGITFAGSYVVIPVNDRVGVVTVTRVNPGAASIQSANQGPFTLADGLTYIVTDEVGAETTLTIQAEAASAEGATAENYDLTTAGDRVLTLQVNGGALQTATITTGDVVDISAVTAEELAAWINTAFTGVSAAPSTTDTKVTVTTDRKGLSASLLFGGAMRSIIGFSASLVQSSQLAADNTVQDVDAVTVDELVDLLGAILARSTPSNNGGYLLITRDLDGPTGTLTISGTAQGTAPKINYTSLGPITGGTETAPAAVLPAGLRISDGGSNIFQIAADTAFGEDVLSVASISVRQVSGTTVAGSAIDTFVDAPDTDDFPSATVTNPDATSAKPATESAWNVKYAAALAALEADTPLAKSVTAVISARHGVAGVAVSSLTGAIAKSLTDHCVTMQGRGVPRWAPVAPPIATPKATARSASGVGVSSTTAGGRHKRRAYCWPAFRRFIPEIVTDDPSLDGIIDWPSDVLVASKASLLAPELSLSQPGDELRAMLSLESYYLDSGTGGALSQVDYELNKAAGICSPRMDDVNGAVLQSQVMSVDPATDPEDVKISDRRMRDWIYRSLLNFAGPKQSKLATPSRRRSIGGDIAGWFEGLVDQERIAAYMVKEDTPTAFAGTGVFVWRLGVQLLDHLDHLGFRITASRGLDVEGLL